MTPPFLGALLPVLIVMFAAGCERQERSLTVIQAQDEAGAGAASDRLFAAIAERQRELLVAVTDSAADPGAFVTADNFTLIDGANPGAAITRLPGGRWAFRQDYFRLLSRRLAPGHATAEQLEVYTERPGHALVLATHPGLRPTLTAWEPVGDDWKATRMTYNTPDSTVAAVRARYSPLAPRARG